MDKIKRKLSFDYSDNKEIKRLGSIDERRISISFIENLSNDIFYEIFDYLDGIDIYEAFSNLNYRFQQLLNASSLLFKIKLKLQSNESYMNIYKQLILINRHQIFSFHLDLPSHLNQFFSSFIIDMSLKRVESLVLVQIKSNTLISLLINLVSLPRLFSLTIYAKNDFKNLNHVYQLIFTLPVLKYNRFNLYGCNRPISLPMAIERQLSSIEHLVMNHYFTFKELYAIISYTPQLCHLDLGHQKKSDPTIETLLPIRKLDCKLKVLRFTSETEYIDYLDANRWERLILQNLPQLEDFHLKYYVQHDDVYESSIYLEDCNQFTSSFWIERKWIFEAEIGFYLTVYSIQLYKERWYDINFTTALSNSARVTLIYLPDIERLESLIIDIRDMLAVTQIYHLKIYCEDVFFVVLLEIIYRLPELDSLQIPSLSLSSEIHLTMEQKKRILPTNNKIRKIYLEEMTDIEEVIFLITFCPYVNVLQVNCADNIDIELFVKDILTINNERNYYLRSLCFHVSTANEEMVKKLEEMINCEKLLLHYTIKRVRGDIYLNWE
ncbi:unnamed protein product [Rotaria sordida]|uniref:F-box domain-containing protein n=1 Tax=Rotaria sordida TaxID=392033 RepID=A0A814SBN3_9BILA|nr:unnamed protein product [Rotaria sordida]